MKLEITQPQGTPHEVELTGPEVVIGREPSCDLVLNDNRCSRRHAVIEETPDGLVVRDAGSANGIYVNGRRMERSPLEPGDTLRLGATLVTVLAEIPETLVVPPEGLELDDLPLRTSPSVPSSPASTPTRRPGSTRRRPPVIREGATSSDAGLPLTVTALAVLWGLSAPASLAGGILVAARGDLGPLAGALAVGIGLLLGAVGVLMALGLKSRAAWARHLQIAAAAVGLVICPFTFASVTILIYMLRPDVRATFEGPSGGSGAGAAEPAFALSFLGMLGLGLGLAAAAALVLPSL